ncbi:25157_t:CDS:1, partial [Cetraspora pellucida]
MSNEEYICNNSFTNHNDGLVVNASKQADLSLHGSQDYLNSIIEELCDLYNKEVMKGNHIGSILCSINNHFTNKQKRPEEIIDLCLNNQTNPI